jgi:serine O-acetyltransferase
MRVKALLLGDLAVNWSHRGRKVEPSTSWDIVRSLADPRFAPIVLVRAARAARARGGALAVAGRAASMLNRLVFGVECAPQTDIGAGLYFPHTGGIVIGAERIGSRCTIYHQVTLGAKEIDMAFTAGRRPVIGDDVTIASGAKVLGGVVVGDRAVIAANAVVVSDVSPGQTVGGVPATVVREGA